MIWSFCNTNIKNTVGKLSYWTDYGWDMNGYNVTRLLAVRSGKCMDWSDHLLIRRQKYCLVCSIDVLMNGIGIDMVLAMYTFSCKNGFWLGWVAFFFFINLRIIYCQILSKHTRAHFYIIFYTLYYLLHIFLFYYFILLYYFIILLFYYYIILLYYHIILLYYFIILFYFNKFWLILTNLRSFNFLHIFK